MAGDACDDTLERRHEYLSRLAKIWQKEGLEPTAKATEKQAFSTLPEIVNRDLASVSNPRTSAILNFKQWISKRLQRQLRPVGRMLQKYKKTYLSRWTPQCCALHANRHERCAGIVNTRDLSRSQMQEICLDVFSNCSVCPFLRLRLWPHNLVVAEAMLCATSWARRGGWPAPFPSRPPTVPRRQPLDVH